MKKQTVLSNKAPNSRLNPIKRNPNNNLINVNTNDQLSSRSAINNYSDLSSKGSYLKNNGTNLSITLPFILIDQVQYTEKKIREIIEIKDVLNNEVETLRKISSEKNFIIRNMNIELKDLRQNYDKVKSVLDQKMKVNDADKDLIHHRSNSALRLKKLGVFGESFSPSSVEMKIYEKPEESLKLIQLALKNCSNDFMKKLESKQIIAISQYMYEMKVKANSYIIREGEVGDHMYVLASGKLEVTKDSKKLREMFPGELFGELAVLQNCLRTASVKAICEASFWAIDRRAYQTILQKFNTKKHEEHKNFLLSVKFLKDLAKENIMKVADALMPESYKKGEYIVKEGEDGQTFFIIKSGQVKVEQTINERKEPTEIRQLHTGDYFGERALLKNEIRTASVVAISDLVEVLTLDQDDFIRLIGHIDEIKCKNYGDDERNAKMTTTESNISKKHDTEKKQYGMINYEDLEFIKTLGIGGFGKVELVRYKKNKTMIFALKCLQKKNIVDMKQQDHIHSERNIMLMVKSAHICKLYRTFCDKKYVYMLLEACLGGEVWTILRNKSSFDDRTSKFVLACVILAIQHLHKMNIIYRDLKPENLILDKSGYVKLCDFGFAKKLSSGKKTFTFCGTPEYVAPEIILNKGHDNSADLWSIGILLYELLTGGPPFQGDDPVKIYNQILKGIDKVEYPSKVSKVAQNFIKCLCKDNPTERLGYGKEGISDLINHRYFIGFNWDSLIKREMTAPIVPRLDSDIDTKYFDEFPKDTHIPPDETSGWEIGFEY